jgi:hypothetical protein
MTDPQGTQRVMGATLTRFGVLERPQLLTSVTGQVTDLEVNRSGAAAGILTELRVVPSQLGGKGPVVRVVWRAADERAARVSLTAELGAAAVRLRARCDEPCRLRAAVAGRVSAAAAPRRSVTLRPRRHGSFRVPLGRRAREHVAAGRRVTLVVRAADGAGNVRTLRRRLGR